jgi:hypothetical protein
MPHFSKHGIGWIDLVGSNLQQLGEWLTLVQSGKRDQKRGLPKVFTDLGYRLIYRKSLKYIGAKAAIAKSIGRSSV